MKMLDDFVVREIAGQYFAIPCKKAATVIKGLIALNETGVEIFSFLHNGISVEDGCRAMCEKDGYDYDTLLKDAEEFVAQLADRGVFEKE